MGQYFLHRSYQNPENACTDASVEPHCTRSSPREIPSHGRDCIHNKGTYTSLKEAENVHRYCCRCQCNAIKCIQNSLPHLKSLKSTNMTLGAYTNSEIPVLGKCTLYLRHPETKKYILTTFYVADHEGSVLLSCRSSFELDVIRIRPRISNSAPRSTVITSKVDHPKHTKKCEKIPQPAPWKNKEKNLFLHSGSQSCMKQLQNQCH